MKRIALFTTAGHTEVGGMKHFIEHISPEILCTRLFPAVRKPAPKKGLDTPAPVAEHSGVTGDRLVSEMISSLSSAVRKGDVYDAVLLVDDGDCRFSGEETLRGWIVAIEKRILEEAGCAWPLFVLMASPEAEAWFCADWEQSFAKEYPRDIQKGVRAKLASQQSFNDEIELFGMPQKKGGGCSIKLSELIQRMFCDACDEKRPYSYSKAVHGQAMLKHIRPEKVAERCRRFFRPVFIELCEWIR